MTIDKFRVLEIPRKHDGSSGVKLLLRSGDVVPRSGIYEIIHGSDHEDGVAGNTVVALRREIVQPCNTCGEQVQLRLVYEAPHVSEDPDFQADTRNR